MKKIAVFPGSFDPFTVGHESIVRRAIPLFDEVIIAIGYNSQKQGFFPLETRLEWIKKTFADAASVRFDVYEGLTIDFCTKNDAQFLLRGLRTSSDFEYERAIAQMNKTMNEHIETVFMLTMPEHSSLSSSIVREIVRYKSDASKFVPPAFAADMKRFVDSK